MKTTVDLPDSILRQARIYAANHGITLREVFERGVQAVIEGRATGKKFRLKTVVTKGEGLICDDDWAKIRSLIYEGHGG
jgi:hypothetical protein